MQLYSLGSDQLGRNFAEKELGTDNKLTMAQQCTLGTEKTSNNLDCIRKLMPGRSGKVILPFLALMRPIWECWVQCWGNSTKKPHVHNAASPAKGHRGK